MTPKTDWPALVGRLERYYRHLDIAAECGHTERWVGMLKAGEIDEPKYSVGVKLIAMDRELHTRLATQASTIPMSLRASFT